MIFTFYSFKGGVGRSMMLANAAEHLSQRGLKVLMVDFDLEAPGLERFFSRMNANDEDEPNSTPLPDHSQLVASRGIVDLLVSFKTLQALPPPEPLPPVESTADGEQRAAEPQAFPFPVEPLDNFVVPIRRNGEGSLCLMPAGRRDNNEYSLYAERVRTFDWDEFYAQFHGAQFFNWFGEQLKKNYDVVLIDSRTGITEMSGVCTHQLADAVVLFVAANDQNLEGTRRMADSLLRKELADSRGSRPLSVLIVPSRVELAEGQKLKDFSDKFAVLAERIDERIKFSSSAFLDLRVPYVPFYAFGERVAIREPELPIAADMIAAATRICSAMIELVPNDSPAYSRYQAAQSHLPRLADTTSFDKPPADFTGRDWVFDAIAAWLDRPSSPIMLIVGGPGSGKTTIASRLVVAADEHTTLAGGLRPGGQLVVAHSCQLADGWRPFLEKMVRAFAARWPAYVTAARRATTRTGAIAIQAQGTISGEQSFQSIRIEDGVSPEVAFQALVQQPLYDIAQSGAPTAPAFILIDGLDEVLASDWETLADFIAAGAKLGWPPQVKLAILSRRDSRILRMSAYVIELDSDHEAARRDIVAYASRRLADRVGPQEVRLIAEQIAAAAAGNFLYARTVLNAALEDATDPPAIAANVDRVLKPGQVPVGLHAAYVDMIQREVGFNTERWSTRYRPVLGLLAIAPEGFTAEELAGITDRPRTDISDNLRLMQRLVVETQTSRKFRLFHSSFATFLLTDTEYGVSAVEAGQMIASYFVNQHAEHWDEASDLAVQDTDRFFIEAIEAATDRRKGRELSDRLAELLLDPTFVEAKLARGGAAHLDLRRAIAVFAQAAPATHPRREMLLRLDGLLRSNGSDLLAKLRQDPKWLPAELAGPGDIAEPGDPASSTEKLVGAGTPTPAPGAPAPPYFSSENVFAPAPMSAPSPPVPDDFVTDEMLRRRVPTYERVALTLAFRARVTGAIILCLSLSLAGVLFAGRFLTLNGYLPDDLLFGIYAVTALGALYLAAVAALRQGMGMGTQGPPGETADWERLPEIVALRAQRPPHRILGGLSMASPYFEAALVVLIAGAIVGTVSAPVELLRGLEPARISEPSQKAGKDFQAAPQSMNPTPKK